MVSKRSIKDYERDMLEREGGDLSTACDLLLDILRELREINKTKKRKK